MHKRLLHVFIALAVCSCGPVRPQDRMCKAHGLTDTGEPNVATLGPYFPLGFPGQLQPDNCGIERPRLNDVTAEWYSSQWNAACEPPLKDAVRSAKNAQFVFRFSFIPSFDSSLFIRLEPHEKGHTLIVKQMTGSGGYDPGVIARSKEIELTDKEVAAIQERLVGILETRDENVAKARLDGPKNTCLGSFDGTMWIFETVRDGQYDLVEDISPKEGPLFDLGNLLLKKTGWVDVSDI